MILLPLTTGDLSRNEVNDLLQEVNNSVIDHANNLR